MGGVPGASSRIQEAVRAWPGVEAQPHHLLPQSGWGRFDPREEGAGERAVSLLARSYELAREQQARKHGTV